jgi:hypothetical protein
VVRQALRARRLCRQGEAQRWLSYAAEQAAKSPPTLTSNEAASLREALPTAKPAQARRDVDGNERIPPKASPEAAAPLSAPAAVLPASTF